jgi:hypothetical protein
MMRLFPDTVIADPVWCDCSLTQLSLILYDATVPWHSYRWFCIMRLFPDTVITDSVWCDCSLTQLSLILYDATIPWLSYRWFCIILLFRDTVIADSVWCDCSLTQLSLISHYQIRNRWTPYTVSIFCSMFILVSVQWNLELLWSNCDLCVSEGYSAV